MSAPTLTRAADAYAGAPPGKGIGSGRSRNCSTSASASGTAKYSGGSPRTAARSVGVDDASAGTATRAPGARPF
jgi:hypothetical protein